MQAVEAWQQEQQVHCTPLDALLGGLLQSTVCCSVCGRSSHSFEYFLDLSLPLPRRPATLTLEVLSAPLKPTGRCTVQRNALASYTCALPLLACAVAGLLGCVHGGGAPAGLGGLPLCTLPAVPGRHQAAAAGKAATSAHPPPQTLFGSHWLCVLVESAFKGKPVLACKRVVQSAQSSQGASERGYCDL